MLKPETNVPEYNEGLITVQDNTMLKLLNSHLQTFTSLITVQDNTMLKHKVDIGVYIVSLITVQDNTMLKHEHLY